MDQPIYRPTILPTGIEHIRTVGLPSHWEAARLQRLPFFLTNMPAVSLRRSMAQEHHNADSDSLAYLA